MLSHFHGLYHGLVKSQVPVLIETILARWDSSAQIVMVVEVLNMFKNERSCTVTVQDLSVHTGTIRRNKLEDFIFYR